MPKFSANLSMLYPDLPFLDRFAAAAKDGFGAVEYLAPYDHAPELIAERLATNGLVQALFNAPAGDWGAGERGIACLPGREEEFRQGIDTAIRYARALRCPKVNVLCGIAPADGGRREQEATLVANLGYAAPRMRQAGIMVVFEPINRIDIPGYFVSDTDHAERILAAVGSDNLFIQYDFYHMQIVQGDLVRTYERLRDKIGHVQIADNPGRNEPGTGEINYAFVLSELDRLGYDGWVGCEYRPKSGAGAAVGWMQRLQMAGQTASRFD
jgi:hydroxypyruvate isomerase